MSGVEAVVAANLARVRRQIDDACRRVGREPAAVHLVAVTKSAQISWIDSLLAAGVRDLGESRPQQLAERAPRFGRSVAWHLVGHLQRNKVRKILPLVAWIHSVDTLALLRRLNDVAGELGLRPKLLLEVNVSGEAAKHGFHPAQLTASWEIVAALPHVEVAGLMTMAPLSENPEAARPTFAGLRKLRDSLVEAGPQSFPLPELSMGMSGDFEVAVEEGATMVRVGTSLFEGLGDGVPAN